MLAILGNAAVMTTSPARSLTTSGGVVLYIGALLGPGLLLLPGLAAAKAGPASILAWIGLLALSGLLAVVFAALGVALPSAAGVNAFAEAGLGSWAGRAVGWCFLAGIVTGAPIVSLIGGTYLAELLGGGRWVAAGAAGVLLIMVVAVTFGGMRASSGVQLALVTLMIVIVAVAVAGSAVHADAANWTPFAPHGWPAVGSAAAVLMLSFVGWEAVAPLTARFANPRRQLPQVITFAFAITSALYLALAVVTIAALGPNADTAVPLAALLVLALGPVGTTLAALAAVLLTLATTNAYLTGAAALARSLTSRQPETGSPTRPRRDPPPTWLLVTILTCGAMMNALTGVLDAASLVTVPTTFFLTVYLGCTLAACRLLSGAARVAAACATTAVTIVLGFTGWALIPAAGVTLVAIAARSARSALTPRTARHPRT